MIANIKPVHEKTEVIELCEDERYCTWYKCLRCEETNIIRHFKFCPVCGSKISWKGFGKKKKVEQYPGLLEKIQ